MVFTAEQIQQYKDKYKQVYEITVEDKSCLVRKPNRKDLSYVSTQKDPHPNERGDAQSDLAGRR